MTLDEELALRAENERLRAEDRELRAENEQLAKQVAELVQLVADLQLRLGGRPSFVKRNRPKSEDAEKKPRRKRAKDKNHGRCIETPTRAVEHRLERCPKCNCRLGGKSLHYTRQVVELPPPQPVEVIEHRVFKCFCPRCGKWQRPKLDLTGQVFGKGRMGVRITSTIAYLRNTMRLPVR